MKSKRLFKKGFTLSEVMIAITVIGILAAILIPAVVRAKPNRSKIMFKKAYYDTENIVDTMISDDTLYPSLADNNSNELGFLNTLASQAGAIGGTSYSGGTKFCNIFAEKINTVGITTCNAITSANALTFANNTSQSFVSSNGVYWAVPNDAFFFADYQLGTHTGKTWIPIVVDSVGGITNTSANNPNCMYDDGAPNACPHPDRFTISVRDDGKIRVLDTIGSQYLQDMSPR